MKTTHRIRNSTHPTQVAQCSVVAVVDNNVESVPVYLTKKCCVPPHEMVVHVETIHAPAETTATLIEFRIVTAEDVHSSDVPKSFHTLVLARTVCDRSAVNKPLFLLITRVTCDA